MFYMILYPGFSIGPAGDYGSFDFSSQWRVIQSTTLPDCDPSVNKKIIAVNSRGSSRRIRCASTRRLPLSPKPLKFEDNEQKKHGNKAGSRRSRSVYNVLSATDRKACLMTEQGFPVSLWEDPSFVYADDKSVS